MAGYFWNRNMFVETEKSDCSDSIAAGLIHTGQWRKRIAVKHPSDPRNIRASETLAGLAAKASELTDGAYLRLQPYYGWASEPWQEAVSVAARSVGFSHNIKDIPSFVNLLLDVLSQTETAQNSVVA
jgi:hypothetical protein